MSSITGKITKIRFDNYLYLLLLIPPAFVAHHLSSPGMPFGEVDFPYAESSLHSVKKLWAWIEYGSYHGLETIPRYPLVGFWVVLQILNVSPGIIGKLLIIGGFLIASFSFYFSCLKFFQKKIDVRDVRFKAGAILGSLFYAYNVWSFQRIGHWFLWLGYALLPIFFISVIYALQNPRRWKYVVAIVLLWSLASTTPHMILYFAIVFAGLSLLYIIRNIIKKRNFLALSRPIFLTLILYVFVNFYWIYPSFQSSSSENFLWPQVITEENTRALSSESTFLNVFRLLQGTFNMAIIDVVPPETSTLYPFWVVASFVPPLVAFSALLFKRKLYKYTLYFSGITLVGIILTVGTNSPFNLYSVLFLYNPLLEKFQILFREPDKWGFLIAFGYSFLIAISSFIILNKFERIKHRTIISICFMVFLLSSTIIYVYPTYEDSLEDVYHPIIIPKEFDRLDHVFGSALPNKVFILPNTPDPTRWGDDKETMHLYPIASPAPNISPKFNFNKIEKYRNYLVDSIIENRTNSIKNIVHPLGASHIIYHNDTMKEENRDLLNRLSALQDIKLVNSTGFIKIFEVSDTKRLGQVNIPKMNMLVAGGLDEIGPLNSLPQFNSANFSLIFLDRELEHANDISAIKTADYALLHSNKYNFLLSFVDDKYILEPFDQTNHHNPSKVWSKAGSNDPGNAYFNPYVENLGMQNWDFDYDKGLVITRGMGAKLSIPIDVAENGEYNIFLRYLQNQKGGMIKIYLDGKLMSEVNTLDDRSNNFVWKNIVDGDSSISSYTSSLNLTRGKHLLTLENVLGFNAVNIFAVIPSIETGRLVDDAILIANKTKNIYLLEAESNFYNGMGKGNNNNSADASLINYDNTDSNNNINKIFTGQFKVPANSDLASLQFFSDKQNNDSSNIPSSYLIKNLEIFPGHKKYNVFTEDFERNQVSISLATLRQIDWIKKNERVLSTSLESNNPISGNNSLRVDVRKVPVEKDDKGRDKWNVVSTDFIPISGDAYYSLSMDVSAKDISQLGSKVIYFNSNGERIGNEDIFPVTTGTFANLYTHSLVPPLGTKYMKLEVLVKSTAGGNYLVDNIRLEQNLPKVFFKSFGSVDLDSTNGQENRMTTASDHNDDVLQTTKPFPVAENSIYNYTMNVDAQNVASFNALVSFRNSSDVVENSTKYGANASNGKVLSLSPGSEVYTDLDIIKPSNYTVALRTKTCDLCNSFLGVSIVEKEKEKEKMGEGKEGENIGININNDNTNLVETPIKTQNISLKDVNNSNSQQLEWLYLNNTYLKQGTYELRIYSDSQTDLDSVIIYSAPDNDSDYDGSNSSLSNNSREQYETFEDLFNPKGVSTTPAAYISDYKKINPTKHELKISNATKPYIISFAESYDPLWIAYTNNKENNKTDFKTNSIPIYSIVNGFYVNKTGDYTLTIEYEPQVWFEQAGIVSLGAIMASFAFLIIQRRKSLS